MMLTPDELAAMRSITESALPDSCQVQRYTRVEDGMGGYTDEWNPIVTTACRISENRSQNREVEIGGQIQASGTYIVRVPHGTNIQDLDRLVVTTSGRTRTLAINRVYESSYGTLTNIGCSETRGRT